MVSELGFFTDNKDKDLCLFRHAYLYLAPELIFEEGDYRDKNWKKWNWMRYQTEKHTEGP